jgi:hypothetical protein
VAEHPFPNLSPEPKPFDVKTATATIGQAIYGLLHVVLRAPGTMPDPQEASAAMEKVRHALTAGSDACGEVSRIRGELAALRDGHRPQPHADPTKPGALCAACSMHGSIVSWPCATWSAAERILNHGKA